MIYTSLNVLGSGGPMILLSGEAEGNVYGVVKFPEKKRMQIPIEKILFLDWGRGVPYLGYPPRPIRSANEKVEVEIPFASLVLFCLFLLSVR